MSTEPVLIEADAVVFAAETSTILKDAVREFEQSRLELQEEEEEPKNAEDAWSILAHQVVGHENL